MSGDLARAHGELERRMREMMDRQLAEMLQLDKAPADLGALTIEKLERLCGIFRKPAHKFRFAEQALSVVRLFPNYTNFGSIS